MRCLAGTWDANRQERRMNRVHSRMYEDQSSEWETSLGLKLSDEDEQLLQPIHVNTITVSNLQDFNDKRLTESAAFKSVISSPDLRDLKLFIAHEDEEASPENNIYFPERYDIDCLPRTWLSPALSKHLRTLSLYCKDYWGWCPRLDLRAVNLGSGPDSGFPALRVLALGNYVSATNGRSIGSLLLADRTIAEDLRSYISMTASYCFKLILLHHSRQVRQSLAQTAMATRWRFPTTTIQARNGL